MGQVLYTGMKIFPLGAVGGTGPTSVNLGHPQVSENTRARKLKFYTRFDGAKYPF